MNSLSVLTELFDHYYWARDRQMQICASLTDDQFLRALGGSFASIRDTVVHMLAVEWIWLERYRGRSPRSLWPPSDFPDAASIVERWATVEPETREWLATLDEATLAAPLTIVNTRGQSWTYPLWRMVVHLLNHQSYHRGQVTDKLRILGVQPPVVDFLVAHDMAFRVPTDPK